MAGKGMMTISYSKHSSLNTLDVCQLDSSDASDKFWIVYIHGGAWRDPRVTSASFSTTQSLLLESPSAPRIAGIASLNYRLSPHSEFPSDDPSRTAKHPDHINDILDAIRYLQAEYQFGYRYIIVGHSAGATLAMQAAMSQAWRRTGPNGEPAAPEVTLPVSILGVCGIYDIPQLLASHSHPAYREFITSAFGEQTHDGCDVWAAASPVNREFTRDFWLGGRYVLLAHSVDDELVERKQVENMKDVLVERGWVERDHGSAGAERSFDVLELSGAHNEVWEKGHELARAIETCLQRLQTS